MSATAQNLNNDGTEKIVVPCCNEECRINWTKIFACFFVLYVFYIFLWWALLEAVLDDSIMTLIMFFVVWIISVCVIVGMILYGHFTDALGKI
jgi:hypothetical protein